LFIGSGWFFRLLGEMTPPTHFRRTLLSPAYNIDQGRRFPSITAETHHLSIDLSNSRVSL
jgi:hypothetical protein